MKKAGSIKPGTDRSASGKSSGAPFKGASVNSGSTRKSAAPTSKSLGPRCA